MTGSWPQLENAEDRPEREINSAVYIAVGLVASVAIAVALALSGVISFDTDNEIAETATAERSPDPAVEANDSANDRNDTTERDVAATPAASATPAQQIQPTPTIEPAIRATPTPRPTDIPEPTATPVPVPTATPTPRYDGDWLRADGIGQVDFGASRAEALNWANSVFGPPARVMRWVCKGTYDGQSYTVLEYAQWSEAPYLTSIMFHDGALIGWHYSGQDVTALSTPTGLRVGSSQNELQAMYSGVAIEATPWRTPDGVPLADQDWRHSSGNSHISGFLLNGVVTRMWAGAECAPTTS